MCEDHPGADVGSLRELEGEIPLDEILDVLSDDHARYALYWLGEHPDATLEQLADVVTGIDAAATDAIATPSDRERARIHLYHVVLPKLDAHGYLDFDADDRTVTGANVPPEVCSLLKLDD